MLYFPQLSTGVIAQFPLGKRSFQRTVTNRTISGHEVRLADPDSRATAWQLHYSGLTDIERNQIESFLRECGGKLEVFTFLDPTGNLLRWSEDLTRPVWQKDGLLQISAGLGDPMGLSRAARLTNTSQALQSIEQTVEGPGWFQYCFSVWLQSDGPGVVSLGLSNAEGELEQEYSLSQHWTLVECTGSIPGASTEITCRLDVSAGAVVSVYGMQLEAQPCASEYKKTGEESGLRSNTRFDEDGLHFTAHGADDHSVVVRLYSPAGAIE
jgi:hypothetical protein